MKYRSSIETSLKILTLLAVKKESAQYDMPKQIRKDYRTALRHIQNLEKQGLIKLARFEPASKQGKDRKIYTLTKAGLSAALEGTEIWKDIDTVANNYREFEPLIFGKWDFFEKKGIMNIIIQRLQSAVFTFRLQQGKKWYRIQEGPSEEDIKILVETKGEENAEKDLWRHNQIVGNLTDSVLGFKIYLHPKNEDERVKEAMRVLQILSEDQDIKRYLQKQIKFWKEEYSSYLNNILAFEEWFNTL